jgi:hypothetical protein
MPFPERAEAGREEAALASSEVPCGDRGQQRGLVRGDRGKKLRFGSQVGESVLCQTPTGRPGYLED